MFEKKLKNRLDKIEEDLGKMDLEIESIKKQLQIDDMEEIVLTKKLKVSIDDKKNNILKNLKDAVYLNKSDDSFNLKFKNITLFKEKQSIILFFEVNLKKSLEKSIEISFTSQNQTNVIERKNFVLFKDNSSLTRIETFSFTKNINMIEKIYVDLKYL